VRNPFKLLSPDKMGYRTSAQWIWGVDSTSPVTAFIGSWHSDCDFDELTVQDKTTTNTQEKIGIPAEFFLPIGFTEIRITTQIFRSALMLGSIAPSWGTPGIFRTSNRGRPLLSYLPWQSCQFATTPQTDPGRAVVVPGSCCRQGRGPA
jgi:hypothetical protein